MDLEKEILELAAAVESVRKDAKELVKPSIPSYKSTKKDLIAKSAWAKSGLSRSSSSSNKYSNKSIKPVAVPGPASMNVLNQDLKCRVRAPAVSFGARLRSEQTIGEGASKIYDVKDRHHSKTKRVISLAFGSPPSSGPQLKLPLQQQQIKQPQPQQQSRKIKMATLKSTKNEELDEEKDKDKENLKGDSISTLSSSPSKKFQKIGEKKEEKLREKRDQADGLDKDEDTTVMEIEFQKEDKIHSDILTNENNPELPNQEVKLEPAQESNLDEDGVVEDSDKYSVDNDFEMSVSSSSSTPSSLLAKSKEEASRNTKVVKDKSTPSSTSKVTSMVHPMTPVLHPKAYSFGKASRINNGQAKSVASLSDREHGESLLDIERMNRMQGVGRRTPNVKFSMAGAVPVVTPITDVKKINAKKQTKENSNKVTDTNSNAINNANLQQQMKVTIDDSALSHRPRTSVVSFGKPPTKGAAPNETIDGEGYFSSQLTIKQKLLRELLGDLFDSSSSPRELPVTDRNSFGVDTKGGVVYREKTDRKLPKGVVQPSEAELARAIPGPGPGFYDITAADTTVHPRVPITRIYSEKNNKEEGSVDDGDTAEAKALSIKRYRDQKAADLREDIQALRDVTKADDLVRNRAHPGVVIRPDKVELDPRRSAILRKRAADQAVGSISNRPALDVGGAQQYLDANERGFDLNQEERARESTKRRQPMATRVILKEREAQDKEREKFLGPQLQMAWGDESLPDSHDILPGGDETMMSMQRERIKSERLSQPAPNSPTREIEDMLEAHAAGRGLLAQSISHKKQSDSLTEKHSQAYLIAQRKRQSRTAAIMREPSPPRRNKELATSQLEFRGPQLMSDWRDELAKGNGGKALEMERQRGRDVITRDSNNKVVYRNFSDPVPAVNDPRPPLEWEEVDGGFGSQVRYPRFEKILARDEVVGPQGQKPTAAAEAAKLLRDEIQNEAGEIEGNAGGVGLDIDMPSAKDRLEKHVAYPKLEKIYGKDRFAEKKVEEEEEPKEILDRKGRPIIIEKKDWFKGMVDDIKEGNLPGVYFNKMEGREEMDNDAQVAEAHAVMNDLGLETAKEGTVVELDIKDYAPHKTDTNKIDLDFSKQHGRDVVTRNEDGTVTYRNFATKPPKDESKPELEYDPFMFKGKPKFFVNMDKDASAARGAETRVEEDHIVEADLLYGDSSGKETNYSKKLREERYANDQTNFESMLEKATSNLSSNRRAQFGVDISKQKGRVQLVSEKPQGPVDVDYDVQRGERAVRGKQVGSLVPSMKKQSSRGLLTKEPSLGEVLGSEFKQSGLEIDALEAKDKHADAPFDSKKLEKYRKVTRENQPFTKNKDAVPKVPVSLTHGLEYDDTALDRAKGGGGIGRKKSALTISKQQSRFESKPSELLSGKAGDVELAALIPPDNEGDNLDLINDSSGPVTRAPRYVDPKRRKPLPRTSKRSQGPPKEKKIIEDGVNIEAETEIVGSNTVERTKQEIPKVIRPSDESGDVKDSDSTQATDSNKILKKEKDQTSKSEGSQVTIAPITKTEQDPLAAPAPITIDPDFTGEAISGLPIKVDLDGMLSPAIVPGGAVGAPTPQANVNSNGNISSADVRGINDLLAKFGDASL